MPRREGELDVRVAPRSYGCELFGAFVPPSARTRARGVPLLSGALIARHRDALGGPVLEIELPSRPLLVGVLRAARHADAIVAVAVPAAVRVATPDAARKSVDDAVAAALEALFDRPLVLVARALPFLAGTSFERVEQAIYRDVDAGFTSFGLSAGAFAGDADALARVCAPLLEQDLGVELEIDDGTEVAPETALLLARLDDVLSRAELQLAAVRGAQPEDELGGGLLIAKEGQGARRVPADDVLATARARARDDVHAEMLAFEAAERWFVAHGGAGVAGRLLDALARET